MPIWMVLTLIAGFSVGAYFYVRPLRVLSGREWLVSHVFVLLGLGLASGWLWLNQDNFERVQMLIGGLWAGFGGLCFMATYALRSRARQSRS